MPHRNAFAVRDPATGEWLEPDGTERRSRLYCGRWPRHGFMSGGRAVERAELEPPTSAIGGAESLPLLPTPTASDGSRGPDFAKATRPGAGGDDLTTAVSRLFDKARAERLFKTPTANLGSNGAPQHPDKRKAGGHGPNLDDEVSHLLPVDPEVAEYVPGAFHAPAEWWGPFGPAVHRWETFVGQPAPVPVEFGPRGGRRLAAPFAEWLMGLPRGWVTHVSGLNRARQLKAIGNGAMSQQAITAYTHLLNYEERD